MVVFFKRLCKFRVFPVRLSKMAEEMDIHRGLLGESLQENVFVSTVLVVGAGGIGCELLKNLVLTGFRDIHVIDLDTIDVSNLNRQFLFQKKHVGKSKAKVARESILTFKPDVNITAYHDNITNPEYNVDFFRKFTLVMNALDNRAARNHVNRMCLAADIPLVESGTAGYLGQVTVIKKGLTECYECQPKPTQKTYPGCTIRNTPSEPIHCILWAKHLFKSLNNGQQSKTQLFGEADADEEVSPDTEDPELAENAGETAAQKLTENANNEIERVSTRDWAQDVDYNHAKLFNKFFHSDIKYLLSMDKLWKKRRPPTPITWDEACSKLNEAVVTDNSSGLRDKKLWSLLECAEVFKRSVEDLKAKFENCKDYLVWDKDDEMPMDFVAATANIRSHIFGIATKSRFDVKSMAGNIIPAIATTNAIISGLLVMEALKILSGNLQKCKTVYLNKQPKVKKRLLVPSALIPPNPKCYVCAAKPEVTVHLDVDSVTVKTLEEKLLKEQFNMVAPDVEIDDGKGTILLSSEEGETNDNLPKCLSDFKIGNGSRLKADDFLQNYELVINIRQTTSLDPSQVFIVEGEAPLPVPEEKSAASESSLQGTVEASNEDDVEVVEQAESSARKRKHTEAPTENEAKKAKVEIEDDDIIIL